MRARLLLLILTTLAALLAPTSTPASSAEPTRRLVVGSSALVPAPGQWQLVWNDGFNEPTLRPEWVVRGDTYSERDNRANARGDRRAVKLPGDGRLHLRIIRDPDNPGKYLTGHIGTEGTLAFPGVGWYWEARVKFQPLNGAHSAFWLLSPQVDEHVDTLPELDVAEYFGVPKPWIDDPTELTHHFYWRSSDDTVKGSHRSTTGDGGVPWSREFHQVGVKRTAEAWEIYIDDVHRKTILADWESDPKFPVLSILTKDWELDKLQTDRLSDYDFQVDWIRIWAPPGAPEPYVPAS